MDAKDPKLTGLAELPDQGCQQFVLDGSEVDFLILAEDPGETDDELERITAALRKHRNNRLRAAIPYVTPGGFRDFSQMIGKAVKTPAQIDIIFRFPDRDQDGPLHERIHSMYRPELATQKLRVRYLGEEGRSGACRRLAVIEGDDVPAEDLLGLARMRLCGVRQTGDFLGRTIGEQLEPLAH